MQPIFAHGNGGEFILQAVLLASISTSFAIVSAVARFIVNRRKEQRVGRVSAALGILAWVAGCVTMLVILMTVLRPLFLAD